MIYTIQSGLEEAYRAYMRLGFDKTAAQKLSYELAKVNLSFESRTLSMFFSKGKHIFNINEGQWKGSSCYVGFYPPNNPREGNLWFDPIEVAFSVYVPNTPDISPDTASWLSIHPVYVWQFRTFLRMVKLGRKRIEFPTPVDYMAPERIAEQKFLDFCSDVYHDEALAYAHWFGKSLAGQFQLQNASHFLSPMNFASILLQQMRFWDEAEYSASEFVRIAVSNNTLMKEEWEEINPYESEIDLSQTNRLLFQEWEKHSDIGLITSVQTKFGLGTEELRSTIHYYIENFAQRPPLD